MNLEMMTKLRRALVLHEGYKTHLYKDTLGNDTIGIGYNIGSRGLPADVINTLYQQDVSYFYNKLSQFEWFHELNMDRQVALIDMCFMGWQKFLTFKKMIAAFERKDYQDAAIQMLDSRWATQVKGRATELANVILSGVYDI